MRIRNPTPSAELVLTFRSHTLPLPSLCRVESGIRVQSCPRSPLRGPSIARPYPAIATDLFSLLSNKWLLMCLFWFYWKDFFIWKDCFKDLIYTKYIYHIFFLQQSTILYFELIKIIFNRYMSQSDIHVHKEIDAQFIFFFFTRKLFSLPVLCPGNYMVWVSEHSNTI